MLVNKYSNKSLLKAKLTAVKFRLLWNVAPCVFKYLKLTKKSLTAAKAEFPNFFPTTNPFSIFDG